MNQNSVLVKITPKANEALDRLKGESTKKAFLSALILYFEDKDFNLTLINNPKLEERKIK